jgi:hypothetical protein
MTTIVSNPDQFSQYFSADSASLDKFDPDYADKLVYDDVVVKSGVDPDICRLNFPTAIGEDFYHGLYCDTDKTTNSGGGIEAARNLARCMGDAGYHLGNTFYLPSDLVGDTKAAKFGTIKAKGIYRPAGTPAIGFRTTNGRYRQLAGAPIALNFKKESKGFGKDTTTKVEPRRYHQPIGKPLEIFFPRVTLAIGELVAEKAGLPMPEFPVIGLDGEWLGFWDWVRESGCPIVITEGEKKACCLISRGYAAIGLPGIHTGYRVTEYGEEVTKPDGTTYRKAIARELCEVLQILDTPGREITILFDFRAGDYSQSQEWKAATTTAKLFKSAIAKIAQLPGPDKGADDFAVAGGDIDAVILAAPTFEEIQKQILKGLNKKNREKAWALTYPIAWECNQQYLDIPYPDSGLICIKSPKGSGKTRGLKKPVAKAQAESRKVLLLTHRVVLGEAICKDVDIPWIEEMHGNADRKTEGKAMGFGLCVDSLHPTSQAFFDPLAWEGALIIFDEVEQVLWHALNSATCREHRQAILATLKTLLQTVLSSGGQVILQDADLSNLSIDFVREFSGITVAPWIAVNHWQPSEPWEVKFYDTYYEKGEDEYDPGKKDAPSGLLQDAVKHVNNGGKIWLSCDSQKAKSRYGSKNLEKFLRKRCPGKNILRIDSETVSNPDHPAYQCTKTINGLATLYDIIVCTPTLATGVSVDLRGHFTGVFGIFQGAISDNEVRQSLARVREPIPRFVWCRQIPVGTIGNGSPYYREVSAGKDREIRYNLHLLKEFDFDIDSACDPVAFRFWAKFAARVNTSAWDFRDSVREGLEAEGHIIRSCSDDDAATDGQIKGLRVINQVEEAIEVSQAEDINRKEFEELEKQRSKTDAERYQEEKFRLKDIYRVGEVTPELRQLDQDRWHGKIQLHYFLTHNPDFLWLRDRKHFGNHLHGDGKICQQDIRLLTAKIFIHKTLLDTLQFTNREKEWTNKSPEVIEFARKALRYAADIKDVAGIKISAEKVSLNPIGIVQVFLRQLGLTLHGEKQRRNGQQRERVYRFAGFAKANVYDSKLVPLDQNREKICEPEGLRAQIFEAWVQNDELALFEFRQNGITAVEADVTVDLKSAHSKGSYEKTPPKPQVVTPRTINIEKPPSVTITSTIEAPIEPQPEPTGRMGWVSRWGKWVRASFLAATDGCQYRILIETVGGNWDEVLAWPHQIRWEGASC